MPGFEAFGKPAPTPDEPPPPPKPVYGRRTHRVRRAL